MVLKKDEDLLTDRMKNEEVLRIVREGINILHTIHTIYFIYKSIGI